MPRLARSTRTRRRKNENGNEQQAHSRASSSGFQAGATFKIQCVVVDMVSESEQERLRLVRYQTRTRTRTKTSRVLLSPSHRRGVVEEMVVVMMVMVAGASYKYSPGSRVGVARYAADKRRREERLVGEEAKGKSKSAHQRPRLKARRFQLWFFRFASAAAAPPPTHPTNHDHAVLVGARTRPLYARRASPRLRGAPCRNGRRFGLDYHACICVRTHVSRSCRYALLRCSRATTNDRSILLRD